MLNKTIFEDGNGGQLAFRNNDIATTNSLYVLAYILMFGGNIEASTQAVVAENQLFFDWWGNDRTQPSATWINSETERTLTGIQLNSRSIELITQAVRRDVRPLEEFGNVDVTVHIIQLNKVQIIVSVEEPSNQQNQILNIIWDTTRNEIIENIVI